jgi:hypothetical protein
VPQQCNGAVGPTAEQCDDLDHDCNGQSGNAGQAVPTAPVWYKDVDNDFYADKTSVPTQQCASPGTGWKSTPLPLTDCNDNNINIHPGAQELCGDGVDSNCDGNDSDGYPSLGLPCTAGTFGVCRRTGTNVCNSAHNATQCNVTAGTATSGNSIPSSDPLIDMSQARGGYDPRWDWNCDNNVVVQTPLYDGSFRASACGGSYESACNTLNPSDATCNAGVFYAKFFNCTEVNFFWYGATDPAQCGNNTAYIGCNNWTNAGATCDYMSNTYTVSGQVSCN